jgi:drug/metabolite transporter (DMT)-like permease
LQQTFALMWAAMIWPIELARGGLAGLTRAGPEVWGLAAASGIIYYGLAFWFYITGLKTARASMAGLFLNLIPVFGVGGAYLFLGERLAIVQWLGAILILTAVVGALRLGRVEPIPVLARSVQPPREAPNL